jgi:Fic family protein
MALFTEINRLRADLDDLRPLAPEQEQRVLQKFRLEWNYNSNAIEGNSLTLGETRSLLLHGLTAAGKPMRDHLDIKGHNEAVLWLEDFVRDDRPLTEQFIRGMHEVLLGEPFFTPAQTADGQPMRKMITPGQYKRQPNNVLTATGEVFYFASPEETPAHMTDLVVWYRQEEAIPTMHPVALAAEFHYRFVRIHPFDDGNGRMSRLLMNLILLRHGYPMTVIKADDRNRYLAALAEADAGEPEPFLRFIIENVEASLRLMIRAAKGESIDEPDDLDKKLALLKKTLDRKDNPELIWSLPNKEKLYNNFLNPWVSDLFEQLEKFDFAFLGKSFSVMLYEQGLPFPEEITLSELNSVLVKIQNIFTEQKYFFENFELTVKWESFRQISNDFDLNLNFDFIFEKALLKIQVNMYSSGQKSTGQVNNLLTLPYRHEYDHTQIHKINYQLANKVYDFIAAKLAEADTPPA